MRLFEGFVAVSLLFLLGLLLKNGALAAEGVKRGWSLCTGTLLPSLFPFLVLSELLVVSGAGAVLGGLFSRPVRALLGLSRGGTTVLMLGLLCGFPVGMTAALSLYKKGEISKKEVLRLLLIANNPSLGFLVSTVGASMLGSKAAGGVLFLITWLSSLTLGAFLHVIGGKFPDMPANGARKTLSASELGGCVGNAFFSLLRVFAPVIFFSCVSSCIAAILEHRTASPRIGALLQGLLELTGGVDCAAHLPHSSAFLYIAFFSGFAGLSVCLQLFSVLEELHPPLLPYLATKLSQGLLCLGMAFLYLRFSHPVWGCFSPSVPFPAPVFWETVLPLGVLVLLVLTVFFSCRKQKKEG